MDKLSRLIKSQQAWEATYSTEHLAIIQEILGLVQGVEHICISSVTAHKIDLSCEFRNQGWNVRLLPTFHGIEVKVWEQDYEGCKAAISKAFRDAFPMGEQL